MSGLWWASAVALNDVLSHLACKLGLQISWRDEGCMWHSGHEQALGHTLFGATEEGAQDGDKELSTFL